jgi:SP family sugar:H+ symporter-like MFS transporter
MHAPLPGNATPPSEPVVAKPPSTMGLQGHPKTNYLYVVWLTAVAAIGGLLFGFDSGVVNGTVAALAAAFGTQAAATGFAVASVLVGCAFGAFGAGALANRIGRRPTMIVDALLFLGSAGASGSVGVFIGSRIVAGVAIGAASVLAPMYIAEVAPAHLRGRLASLQQLAIVLGLFFAFLSNDIIAKLSGGAAATFWLGATSWRWMFWVETLPAAAFLLGTLLIPESPRFLVISGKQEEARKLFARIGGSGKELVAQVEKSIAGAHRPRLSDLIVPGTRRIVPVVWVGVGLAALQQLIGINIIFYFGEVLWKAAGATEQLALNINLLTAVINILATIPAIMLIDRVGRKPLLLFGSIGMALALGVVAIVFATAGVGPDGKPLLVRESAITGLVAANLFIVAFAVSWGPVMWVLLGEMFPNRLRAAGLAVSGATNWIANFAVTVTFLPLMKHVGLSWTYGLYTLAAVASVIFVLTAVRETKGKALEEM